MLGVLWDLCADLFHFTFKNYFFIYSILSFRGSPLSQIIDLSVGTLKSLKVQFYRLDLCVCLAFFSSLSNYSIRFGFVLLYILKKSSLLFSQLSIEFTLGNYILTSKYLFLLFSACFFFLFFLKAFCYSFMGVICPWIALNV